MFRVSRFGELLKQLPRAVFDREVQARQADKFLKGKYGKGLDDFFPEEDYQLMHIALFPHNIIHVECVGGDIDKLLGERVTIGCFPWRWIGGESCISRVVAFAED